MLEPGVYVSEDRMTLVNVYGNGQVTVATRRDPDAVWGPPVRVELERRA
jgi:hypothetical protein